MKNINILGCGWLGFPLAKDLISKNYKVNGSTTSTEKLVKLKSENINPFLIELTEDEVIGEIETFLQSSEILIINIPPKVRVNISENFAQKIKNIIPFIEKSSVNKIIFISSTSVYADNENFKDKIDGNSIPNPTTESGKQLLEVENLLRSNSNFKTTILRFGGLVGENRHPIKTLSGRKNIENPNAPINLIHQKDCILIIEKIIKLEVFGEIFNAVYPLQTSRKEYYKQKALELNLSLPDFNETFSSSGKLISSDKLIAFLKYSFIEKP